MKATHGRDKGDLMDSICASLRNDILSGKFAPETRLPSESVLMASFAASRHMIRAAIAELRNEGLVASRQGAGVFVAAPGQDAVMPKPAGEQVAITALLELFEFRVAVETEAAALAAIRRSPAQEEEIFHRHIEFGTMVSQGKPTQDADLALHTAIALGANNRRFHDFLGGSGGAAVVPRDVLNIEGGQGIDLEYLHEVHQEHAAIVTAIGTSDSDAARRAMRAHLEASLRRYRLRRQSS